MAASGLVMSSEVGCVLSAARALLAGRVSFMRWCGLLAADAPLPEDAEELAALQAAALGRTHRLTVRDADVTLPAGLVTLGRFSKRRDSVASMGPWPGVEIQFVLLGRINLGESWEHQVLLCAEAAGLVFDELVTASLVPAALQVREWEIEPEPYVVHDSDYDVAVMGREEGSVMARVVITGRIR